MGIWTNQEHRSILDDGDDFAYSPSGGRVKQWLAGVALPLLPIIYGLSGLRSGHIDLIATDGHLELQGTTSLWLSVAYISLGAFLHFHYFWGLNPTLGRFSQSLKVLSLLALLGSLCYSLYRIILFL